VSLLYELHWLRVPERIDFRLAVLVHRCFNGTAPRYLASELQRVADTASAASALGIVTGVACSAVVAQDHWRPCVPCRRRESLEQAAAGDHVTVVIAHVQTRIEDRRTVPPILW